LDRRFIMVSAVTLIDAIIVAAAGSGRAAPPLGQAHRWRGIV
jgi:hypothetical protein